jgi:hypothetical protein
MVLSAEHGQAGTALAEIFDTSASPSSGALKSVSVRGRVESAGRPLIARLAIASGGSRTLLIRAQGVPPTVDGGSAPLPVFPVLRLLNSSGQVVAEGAPWDLGSNSSDISAAAAAVGTATPEPSGADATLLVSLAAGTYTLTLDTAEGAAGDVRVEIHAVPAQ